MVNCGAILAKNKKNCLGVVVITINHNQKANTESGDGGYKTRQKVATCREASKDVTAL